MNVQLSAVQRQAVLKDLRSKFPDRTEYRFAEVILGLEAEDSNRINLMMAVIAAAVDSKAIYIQPSSIIAIDEQYIVLTYLVNPAASPEMLEVLQQKVSRNVNAAFRAGMQFLAEREKRRMPENVN